MLNLIKNEWMKLWSKKGTWIMLILLVLFIPGIMGLMKWITSFDEGFDASSQTGAVVVDLESSDADPDWKMSVESELIYTQERLQEKDLSKAMRKELEGEEKILIHRLENSIEPLQNPSRESMMKDTSGFTSLVILFTVIVAAGIVASEFSQGTIKMLLSRPIKRWKILTSKLLTVNLYSALLIIIGYALTILFAFIFFQSGDGQLLSWNGKEVVETSLVKESLYMLALSFGTIFATSTFAFMIGVVFRSNSMAIGLSLFIYFTGTSFVLLLERFTFAKYLVFAHMELTQFGTGMKIIEDMTLPFSLTILSIYLVLFLGISYGAFIKRDVKA